MVRSKVCPGLPASWINAWLAAVGATVLDPRIRLSWTGDVSPRAILSAPERDPVALLAESWPHREAVEVMPIARKWPHTEDLGRKVRVPAFASRVAATRRDPHAWTLSSTMTDLDVNKQGEVAHAPFDPPAPQGRVLHERLLGILLTPSAERLALTLEGIGERIDSNGLGFDLSRIGSQSDSGKKWIDPVVEILTFFGLALLPLRGRGTDATRGGNRRSSAVQKGWRRSPEEEGLRFAWPAWSPPLDHAGIDALLDLWQPDSKRKWRQLGIHDAWQTVKYEAKGTADPTRGFGAERL